MILSEKENKTKRNINFSQKKERKIDEIKINKK